MAELDARLSSDCWYGVELEGRDTAGAECSVGVDSECGITMGSDC